MHVKVAGTAGFCWGVQRALRSLDGDSPPPTPPVTLGPLVYNGPVLARLEDRGIATLTTAEQARKGQTVVIRPHGAPAGDRETLGNRGATLLDLTCPHVAATREVVARLSAAGMNVVIAGNREHDEVAVLREAVTTRCWVLASADEAETVAAELPLAVVGQSTLGSATFGDIADTLRERFPGVRVVPTLCGVTEARQAEAESLALEADVLVVVGPYNSGNTRRLAEIARELGKQTFQVELPEDVNLETLVEQARLSRRDLFLQTYADDPERLKQLESDPEALDDDVVIGVTAGASTPPWVLRAIVDRILGATRAGLVQGLPPDVAAESGGPPLVLPAFEIETPAAPSGDGAPASPAAGA